MKKCNKCEINVPDSMTHCPECGTELLDPEQEKRTFAAHRLAGIILIINSVVLLAEKILFKSPNTPFDSPLSILFGLILGIMLTAGHPKALYWAQISILFGGVLFTGLNIYNKEFLMAGIQFGFSLGLIGLLFGRPGKRRIGFCVAIIALIFFIEIIGFHAELTGKNLLGSLNTRLTMNLDRLENKSVMGVDYNYRLTVPEDEWFMQDRSDMKKESPDADMYLINPDYDAYVIVIPEKIEERGFGGLNLFEEIVVFNLNQVSKDIKIVDKKNIVLKSGLKGKLLDVKCTIDGISLHYNYGLFLSGSNAFQIICFSAEDNYKHINEQFEKIIKSLEVNIKTI